MKRSLLALFVAACSGSPEPKVVPVEPAQDPAPPAATTPADSPWPVPAGWRTEVIEFPLDFAPSIAHRGVEEIRFPPGFFDPTAAAYWSYAFLWRTEDAAELDAAALGAELTTYFRGLIDAVDETKRITARDEIVCRAESKGPGHFTLSAHVFDAFKTAAPLDLIGTAERRACGTGALWVFVLAPAKSTLRPQLDALARQAACLR